MGFDIRALIETHRGEGAALHATHLNSRVPQMLKTIGFDRRWASADGAYLIDADGNRFLDMLGGFGMFNVGRNNSRIRRVLIEALELDLRPRQDFAAELGRAAHIHHFMIAALQRRRDLIEKCAKRIIGTSG